MPRSRLLALTSTAVLAASAAYAQPTTSELEPPADLGAEVLVKYGWGYGTALITYQDPLVLFPDGAAFDQMPGRAVASFDPATLQAALQAEGEAEHVGTWRREGDALVLAFAGETRRLPRAERGWWDGDGAPDDESAYDTYFPVLHAAREDLLGPWVSQVLSTAGTPGGAFAASGSTASRVFFVDGTFTEDRDRFASATGEHAGGSVGAFATNRSGVAGRWRIDGPLLTVEEGGRRGVVLAFTLPEWDDEDGDLWIGGDWWNRPDE